MISITTTRSTDRTGAKSASRTKRVLLATALGGALLSGLAGTVQAAVYCDLRAGVPQERQVKTSTRKSYVALQPCVEIVNGGIRPYLKWQNTRGSLGCSVNIGWPPGLSCSIDAVRHPVDFRGIKLTMWVTHPNKKTYKYNCPVDVGDVNSANDYRDACIGTQYFHARGNYKVWGKIEYDVKDDGKDWFYFSSGKGSRNF